MIKKNIIIRLCVTLAMFATVSVIVIFINKHDNFNHITQAIPVIRFEYFDESRDALIIGLFNPGALPMEINRTELFYQADNKISKTTFNHKEYGDKPLVLDPDDTILVPLQYKQSTELQVEGGNYWGDLEFIIPGQTDIYILRHPFKQSVFHNNDNAAIIGIKGDGNKYHNERG